MVLSKLSLCSTPFYFTLFSSLALFYLNFWFMCLNFCFELKTLLIWLSTRKQNFSVIGYLCLCEENYILLCLKAFHASLCFFVSLQLIMKSCWIFVWFKFPRLEITRDIGWEYLQIISIDLFYLLEKISSHTTRSDRILVKISGHQLMKMKNCEWKDFTF